MVHRDVADCLALALRRFGAVNCALPRDGLEKLALGSAWLGKVAMVPVSPLPERCPVLAVAPLAWRVEPGGLLEPQTAAAAC